MVSPIYTPLFVLGFFYPYMWRCFFLPVSRAGKKGIEKKGNII